LAIFHDATATSSVERENNKNQILLVDGISARLVEKKPHEQLRFVQAGVYQDFLFSQTKSYFKPISPGILISFQHKLWSIWRGSVEARWSHWEQKNGNYNYSMPLGLYSKIAVQPDFKLLNITFSPYINAGIGYTILFQGNAYFKLNTPTGFGELSVIGGGGIQVILLKSFGMNVGFDAWKSLDSDKYFVGSLSLGLVKRF